MESLWRKQTGIIKSKLTQQLVEIKQTELTNKKVTGAKQTNLEQIKSRLKIESQVYDVIIVGAGLAGILTAYYLQKKGKSVLILEAGEIASGQTERTTAKITSQHGLKYSTLMKNIGIEKARMYAKANEQAIQEYEKLIETNHINCEFERVSSYLYTKKDETILKEEAKVASFLGINSFFTTETELPFSVKGAVCFKNQAQFSPLEFVQAIASELEILEHTKVVSVKGNQVLTDDMVLEAKKIVIATHYPILNVPGFYFMRQHQERSYVLALSGCDNFKNGTLKNMYYGIDEDGFSFRRSGEALLLGGGSHRTGENPKGRKYALLEQAKETYFPNSKEITRWSAQDCMPHDGIPFIGKYSMFTPNLYVITGFQKWGMTSSMIAAMILTDILCGIKNPYEKLFTPQRLHIKVSFGNFMIDVGVNGKGITKGMFHKPKKTEVDLENGHGGIVTIEGQRYACYKDEEGKLHKISAKCSHMGCELAWNPDEKTWDCPCHGSRFDIDGKLLDNPSKKDEK